METILLKKEVSDQRKAVLSRKNKQGFISFYFCHTDETADHLHRCISKFEKKITKGKKKTKTRKSWVFMVDNKGTALSRLDKIGFHNSFSVLWSVDKKMKVRLLVYLSGLVFQIKNMQINFIFRFYLFMTRFIMMWVKNKLEDTDKNTHCRPAPIKQLLYEDKWRLHIKSQSETTKREFQSVKRRYTGKRKKK